MLPDRNLRTTLRAEIVGTIRTISLGVALAGASMAVASTGAMAVPLNLNVGTGEAVNINQFCLLPTEAGCELFETLPVELTGEESTIAEGATATATAPVESSVPFNNEGTLINEDHFTQNGSIFTNVQNKGTVINRGTFVQAGQFENRGLVTNEKTGVTHNTFTVESGGVFLNSGIIENVSIFENLGLFVNKGNEGQGPGIFTNNFILRNKGDMVLEAGSVLTGSGGYTQFSGTTTFDGTMSLQEGFARSFEFFGGTFGGSGTVARDIIVRDTDDLESVILTDGPLTIKGSIETSRSHFINQSNSVVIEGDFSSTDDGNFINEGTVRLDGRFSSILGTVHLLAGSVFEAGTKFLALKESNLTVDGTLSADEGIVVRDSTIGGSGVVRNKVTFSGPDTTVAAGNDGETLTFEDGLEIVNSVRRGQPVAQTMTNNGNLTVKGASENKEASFINNGTITNDGAFANSGAVQIANGSVFNGTGTYTQTAGRLTVDGTLSQQQIAIEGGTLGGSGLLEGNVSVSGATIAAGNSPGLLSVAGDLDILGGTSLEFELGGTAAGIDYDQIAVTGAATLAAGTIFDVDYFGGFEAGAGVFFDLIVANSFGSINILDFIFDFTDAELADGLKWETSIFALSGGEQALRLSATETVSQVPIPAGLPLAAAGLFILVAVRRFGRKAAA
ncbi:hypothetical protein EOI86_11850 [Hwanghaeella grinnelliae]|uniref:VPLPA-CTERM sorting domain-containing protein n=1 Tax=Hwanghaeella grinnelliae TaxID=2500179 RepID=A0A3S2W416_9PROT|nr:hypothetical protein [Hwanghaeella grinnelliae]RVU35940.1 hypothetical protein EOI86_11850 [Hwanghaeella grinnelliae]